MPFDPGKGNSNGFGNYANPYVPKPPVSNKKKGINPLVFVFAGILVLGFVIGGVFLLNMNKTPVTPNHTGSVITDSEYKEVEIFDVNNKDNAGSAGQ